MQICKNIKILLIALVILLIAFSGCVTRNEQVTKTQTGNVNVSEGSGPDWCKPGSVMTMTLQDGKQVSYSIKGITTYEGKEVCESGWNNTDGSYNTYMNQNKTYNVMVVTDKSGKETRIDMSKK